MPDDFIRVIQQMLVRTGSLLDTLEQVNNRQTDDPVLWSDLADVGAHALALDSEAGGMGADLGAVGAVLRELGRTLVAGRYLPTQVSARLLSACGSRAADGPLTQIAGGCYAAPALAPDGGMTPLTYDGKLHGRAIVPGAVGADFLVAEARSDSGAVVVMVTKPRVRDADPLDLTRNVGVLEFDDTGCDLLAVGATASDALRTARAERRLLNACEQTGTARAALNMAVDYAKEREQFGVPIGAFQAISHSCADMFQMVEGADALLGEAIELAIENSRDIDALDAATLAAAAWCSDTVVECAQRNIQIHGGIAITWEYAAHLLLRRAKSSVAAVGPSSVHRNLLLNAEIARLSAERVSHA